MKIPSYPKEGFAVVAENLIRGSVIELYREEYEAGAHAIYLRSEHDDVSVWRYHVENNMLIFDEMVVI